MSNGDAPSRLAIWLWNEVKQFFTAMFETVWSGFIALIPKAIEDAIELSRLGNVFVNDRDWEQITNYWIKAGMLDEGSAKNIKSFSELRWPLDTFYYFKINIELFRVYIAQLTYVYSNDLRHSLNREERPERPYSQEIIKAGFIAPEKIEEIRNVLRDNGLREEDIDLIFLANYRLYDENMIRTLFLRGVLSKDNMYMRMRELGYTDTRIKEIIESWEIIPPVNDILHMVAKEAFEPDFISKYNLDDEFPTEQVDWIKKQGLSEDWARKYWYAHWEMPSIQMAFDMVHRDVIDFNDLDMLYRAVEIPPYWRDKLTAIAYQPFTRVDVRRMHDMGVLNDEELVRSYKDLGYNSEKAMKMAEFTIRYNAQGDKDLTQSQILKAYKQKLLSRNDTIMLLENLEYSNPEARFIITSIDFDEEQDTEDAVIANIGDRYRNNLLEEYEARSKLSQLNLTGQNVELLIDRWKIDKFEDRKVPSKTDLDKFYRNKIIDLDTYRIEMKRLGYANNYINWYEDLVKMKKAG